MENSRSAAVEPSRHAVLIGIDGYKNDGLNGAVRDVEDIKAQIESVSTGTHITVLTAAKGSSPWKHSAEKDKSTLPTNSNVTAAFNKVLHSASAGDFVYIHFSGHGTRQEPTKGDYNTHTGDLVLVLLGKNEDQPEAYLRGKSLATWLSDMVEAGLVITLVLDCCFSGSVCREDDRSVRCIPYNHQTDLASPPDRESANSEVRNLSLTRGASLLDNWTVDPDKYVMLVACGQDELAKELRMKDGSYHGALSFTLLQVLREDDSLTNHHQDIFERLRAGFRKYRISQNPVLLGNKSQGFFGKPNTDKLGATLPVIDKGDGTLEIQVGEAHRVHCGDQFTLHSTGLTRSIPDETVIITKVTSTTEFTSTIVPLEATGFPEQTRWRARVLSRLALQEFPVRLDAGLPQLDEWVAALGLRFLKIQAHEHEGKCLLHLSLSQIHGDYEIRSKNKTIMTLPVMPDRQVDIGRVSDVLEHLSKFELVKCLKNETGAEAFRSSFKVQLTCNDNAFTPGTLVQIRHNTLAELHFENRGDQKVYVFIYNLGSSWQVENIYKGTYFTVAEKCSLARKLRMKVPDHFMEAGRFSCEDTVKVIVTSQPTSFSFLELGKIDEPTKPGKADRVSRGGGNKEEKWVAVDFRIHTSLT